MDTSGECINMLKSVCEMVVEYKSYLNIMFILEKDLVHNELNELRCALYQVHTY